MVLEKPGRVSVKEVRGRKPRGLATSWYQGGPQALSPGGWRGSQRVAFCSVKVLTFFLCRSALARHALQAKRPKASQSDTSKVGE